MTNIFKSYTRTVQKLLQRYNKELASAFIDNNIEEIWQSSDNWNGGIDVYMIKLNLPIDLYCKLRNTNSIEEYETLIKSFYTDMMKGEGSIRLSGVALSPRDDIQIDFGINTNDSMWKPGYFRLFISHVSANKESASNLKQGLLTYGIDCFVAHEDITPSKEWEIEVENGLFTMDALCAIVVPEFPESKWCDQEVGIALGQHKLVISINKGANPYGFFGKFQALKSKKMVSEMALEVWKAISGNERTKDIYSAKLIELLLNVKNDSSCKGLLNVLDSYEDIDKYFIDTFHSHYNENEILMHALNLSMANQIFKRYALDEIIVKTQHWNEINDTDILPF